MILSPRKNLESLVQPLVSYKTFEAFKKIDRKYFVPREYEKIAYVDNAISLGPSSSISQPSLVAKMIDLLDLRGNEKVLEIGTGSGYSTAILSLLCKEVHTFEINPNFAKSAKKRLKDYGFENILVYAENGCFGIPNNAPFDAILVNAVVEEIPKALISQLKESGNIVVPIQVNIALDQELFFCKKVKGRLIKKAIMSVKFVPLRIHYNLLVNFKK